MMNKASFPAIIGVLHILNLTAGGTDPQLGQMLVLMTTPVLSVYAFVSLSKACYLNVSWEDE